MSANEGIVKLEAEGLSLIQSARQFQVRDADSYQEGGIITRNLARFIKAWDAFMDPMVDAATATLKTIRSQRDKIRVPAVEAKKEIGGRMEAWDRAERERIRSEQARLAAEAQEEARLGALVAAETRGDEGAVATIAADDASAAIVFAPPAPEPPKVEGISYQVRWSAEVIDLAALVRAVAAGQAPLKVLKANEVVLNGMASALKEAFVLPGVRAVSKRSQSTRIEL